MRRLSLFVILMLLLPLPTLAAPGPARAQAAEPVTPAALLDQLAAQQAQVAFHEVTGKVRFVGADSEHPLAQPSPLPEGASPEAAALQFLGAYGELFGLQDAGRDLRTMRVQAADGGRSFVRFQQVIGGIPVLGGELIVQLNAARDVLSVNGEVLPDATPAAAPAIASAQAAAVALAAVAQDAGLSPAELQATEPQLWVYDPRLLGAAGPQISVLVWRMEVQATDLRPVKELVLVDAQRGAVALRFSEIDTGLYRKIYNNNNVRSAGLPGTGPVRTEGQAASSVADVNLAYDYAGDVYNFYLTNHGRDSLDGAGMQLVSTVRYCDPDPTTNCPYDNAFWNGTQMVYGQGYASADDVVAHEMTHAVTDFESHLFYYMQSGAINEALSDIWGEFVDLTNGKGTDTPAVRWLMGEDVPGGAIRSMSNPPAYNDPDRIGSSNYWCDPRDSGGVHTNSGVLNKAAYLITDGGTFNSKTVTGLGIVKTAKIFYELQTHLLTSAGDFQDVYNGLQQACVNLTGTSGITASDCQQVKNAVDAVQMNQQPAQCAATEAPVCPAGQTATTLFSDNLENTGSGNWTKGAVSGSNAWYYPQNPNPYTGFDATYATSGQYNFWGDDPETRTDSYIALTKNVALPAGSAPYLRFNHAYGFETSTGGTMYDGGVIEYSTDSGSTWKDGGSLITDNGYRGTLSSANALGARSAFGGRSNGYISSRLNLSSLAGKNMRFRFRLGTNSSGYDWGWFIDDISVYTCAAAAPDVSLTKRLVAGSHKPGDAISFVLTVTNLGSGAASQIEIVDTVPAQISNLSYSSTLPVTKVTGPNNYKWTLASLAAGASGTITVNGKLSTGLPANFRLVNTATVTAPNDSNPSNNSGSAIVGGAKVYLPVMVREWPPFPATPVLNPINNPSGAASYSVTWASAARATGYILRESFNDPSFGSATQVYSGGDLAWAASGKAVGAYYYSVKATSATGASGWSNVQSVVVTPPPLPTQLAPIADATVAQAAPTLNMGDTDDMIVGYEHCGYGNGVWRSMLKFDLSAIPASKAITSAKLRVYFIEACDIGSRTHTVRTSRITGNWTELGVTWNNQPGVGTQYGTAQVTSGTWQWIEFDVTALVRGWINGSIPNQGVMLRGPEASDNSSASLGFLTRDYSDAAERPYLSIAYAGQAAAEPGLPASGPALPRDCSRSAAQRLWSEGLAAPGFSAARACAAQ